MEKRIVMDVNINIDPSYYKVISAFRRASVAIEKFNKACLIFQKNQHNKDQMKKLGRGRIF